MRRTLILTTAALVLLLAPAAFAFTTEYTADLSGAEEVPPVATDATGDARLLLSDDGTQLKFRVAVRDLDEITQSHIRSEEHTSDSSH